jgi:hypothetical protein
MGSCSEFHTKKKWLKKTVRKKFVRFDLNNQLVFTFVHLEKRLVEKTVTLNAEEYERLLAVESAEEKSKEKLWYNWFARLRKQEPFRTLDEVTLDMPGIRPISITFTGFRRRTKDVLLSFMYKEEISCWMKQADHEEKQQQPGTSPSRRVGVRQRLNRSSDNNLTD